MISKTKLKQLIREILALSPDRDYCREAHERIDNPELFTQSQKEIQEYIKMWTNYLYKIL